MTQRSEYPAAGHCNSLPRARVAAAAMGNQTKPCAVTQHSSCWIPVLGGSGSVRTKRLPNDVMFTEHLQCGGHWCPRESAVCPCSPWECRAGPLCPAQAHRTPRNKGPGSLTHLCRGASSESRAAVFSPTFAEFSNVTYPFKRLLCIRLHRALHFDYADKRLRGKISVCERTHRAPIM